MIDNTAALHALRTTLAGLSVCASVDGDVAATTSGYTSTLGNFITRGFTAGMELQPAGFTDTAPRYITAVTASTITTFDAPAAESAGAGKTIAVGVPSVVGYENVQINPPASLWMLDEEYLPGPVQQISLGPLGLLEALPQYIVRLYGIAKFGPEALYAVADAVLALFAPRTRIPVAATDSCTVRTTPAPYRGQLTQVNGRPMVSVTIPLRLRSPNVI